MKKFKLACMTLALIAGIGLAPLALTATTYATPASEIGEGAKVTGQDAGKGTDLASRVKTVVNVLLFVIGFLAVIMIIIGGIRYTVSGGDSSHIKGAKDTILYAIVGLIVAILAFAIVNFVISKF